MVRSGVGLRPPPAPRRCGRCAPRSAWRAARRRSGRRAERPGETISTGDGVVLAGQRVDVHDVDLDTVLPDRRPGRPARPGSEPLARTVSGTAPGCVRHLVEGRVQAARRASEPTVSDLLELRRIDDQRATSGSCRRWMPSTRSTCVDGPIAARPPPGPRWPFVRRHDDVGAVDGERLVLDRWSAPIRRRARRIRRRRPGWRRSPAAAPPRPVPGPAGAAPGSARGCGSAARAAAAPEPQPRPGGPRGCWSPTISMIGMTSVRGGSDTTVAADRERAVGVRRVRRSSAPTPPRPRRRSGSPTAPRPAGCARAGAASCR